MALLAPSPGRLAADASGAAAVEFALVFPVLLTVILGIWYTGWAMSSGGEVRHAVELASRIYITNPNATNADLQAAVTSHLVVQSRNLMVHHRS
ncbi:MAG: pilus assembly protein [Caulobacteraceae bacterium]|nr:pilus assembly protein [Caulobacteraceae bacterium]